MPIKPENRSLPEGLLPVRGRWRAYFLLGLLLLSIGAVVWQWWLGPVVGVIQELGAPA